MNISRSNFSGFQQLRLNIIEVGKGISALVAAAVRTAKFYRRTRWSCELILEMEGAASLRNAWSFDKLLALWESS